VLYNKTLQSALDEHAPLKVSNIHAVSLSARWYNAECRLEKIKTPTDLSVDEFANHFTAKVNGLRAATTSAPGADVEPRATSSFSAFQAVTEIKALLKKVPPKHCGVDPVPMWLVKKDAVVLAPTLCQMYNTSLSSGTLPKSQNHAIVRPLLKKRSWTLMILNSDTSSEAAPLVARRP